MAIIKCKMCGGDLMIEAGSTVAECEYCGSKQTIPTQDNEKKLTLFSRANRLRMNSEFDKAFSIYESIVAEFPEEAEAYWGLVLCKYGIEYVDDPATGKKIPTCHRSSFESVMEDPDLEQAVENADVLARRVYREEAKQIEEIRKGILEVSSKEEPYDIFICYKETAENGDRTIDSVIAQDVYDALTDKGYRVFFSRISLEDKLGQEYEPYIFAALNSAKIMLAFGTDYEYYNAVWVKNEWSRYLKLMAKDKTKHLIPCYKNIDAYDMPKEFAKLQAQDMGKVGAVQDLLRGIEKILPKSIPASQTFVGHESAMAKREIGDKLSNLLERGNIALEDGAWQKADSFYEDALNTDPHCAEAYLGKLLAQENCRTVDAFVRKRKEANQACKKEQLELSPDNDHIARMVQKLTLPRYLTDQQIKILYPFDLHYPSAVAARSAQKVREQEYWKNNKLIWRVEQYMQGPLASVVKQAKADVFSVLDSQITMAKQEEAAAIQKRQEAYAVHLTQADEKAEQMYSAAKAEREKDYQKCLAAKKAASSIGAFTDAAAMLRKMDGFKDSQALVEECKKEVERLQEAERRTAAADAAAKKRRKTMRMIFVALAAAAVVLYIYVVQPMMKYNAAKALFDSGKYEEAIAAFEAMSGYKDSTGQIELCQIAIKDQNYYKAISLKDAGNYEEAIEAFEAMVGYRDSEAKIAECRAIIKENRYQYALIQMNVGKYPEAIAIFRELNGYLESAEKIEECQTALKENDYHAAVALVEKEKYIEATAMFEALRGYRDSDEQIKKCTYLYAKTLQKSNPQAAAIAFGKAGNYQDAATLSRQLWDQCAERATISAGGWHTVGLKTDGTVVAVGRNDDGRCNVGGWKDIVAVSADNKHTVGLKENGTVVAAGDNECGQCDVRKWQDIVAICAGDAHTVGLKADGTVVAVGDNSFGQCDVSDWEDIVAICAGGDFTAGLKLDGTVVAVGKKWDNRCEVSGMKDIVAISAAGANTIGLKADGTVVAVGDNSFGQCDVSDWKNIVAICAGGDFTAGLKADGTTLSVGLDRKDYFNNPGSWKNIVEISTGGLHAVGLKVDGTVNALGYNEYGECNVGDWKNIKLP
ncbi:MAG: TIR domain-containing protein [Candidatus Faecousia sp.]|nr:TIR domain-containing protein [Candidatus Faecousia sp.]